MIKAKPVEAEGCGGWGEGRERVEIEVGSHGDATPEPLHHL